MTIEEIKNMVISIHALVKRATLYPHTDESLKGHFNPRPRKEGDTTRLMARMEENNISIHALVKRATGYRSYSGAKFVISIHALVKRATLCHPL